MKLDDYLDVSEIRRLISEGYIREQFHSELPVGILNYSQKCMFENVWTNEICECRGLVYEKETNLLIGRPLRKFFNLGQMPEYSEENLPNVIPTVTEKMDGWYIQMNRYKGQVIMTSRGSFTSPGAEFANNKMSKLVRYGATEEFPDGYTPIFEGIFKACKIVVDYPFEGLVLLSMVRNETGEEMPYDRLLNVWGRIAAYSKDNRPWIRLVKAHNLGDKPLESAKAASDDASWGKLVPPPKDQEGYVLTYPRPGTYPIKIKIKFSEYKRLHKLITGITPQQIWKSLHDPMEQWLGGDIPDHFRKWALQWRDQLYASFHRGMSTANFTEETLRKLIPVEVINNISGRDPLARQNRRQVLEALERTAPDYTTIILDLLDGRHYNAHQAIWDAIKPVGKESTFYRDGDNE